MMANVVFLKGKVKFIFAVIMHEPHIYQKALCFFYSKQSKCVIISEFA